MEAKPDLQTLIARKLEGTITPGELEELEAMLAASPEASNELDFFEKVWTTSRKLSVAREMTQEARWQNLQEKIVGDLPAARNRRLVWLRYAAVAAVLSVFAVVYVMNNDDWVTISTRAGEAMSVTLPDSSRVKLEGNAVLSYNASDWKSKRNLRLTGDAFFEVRRNGTSFIVESSNARVAVLGTSFQVSSSVQRTVVICFTGKVSVEGPAAGREVILTPGLEVSVKGDALSDPYKTSMSDIRSDDLSFHDAPLPRVFESLARFHNKQITLSGNLDSVSFTGNLAGTSLESALKTVCLSAGLEFTISGDSVSVKSR